MLTLYLLNRIRAITNSLILVLMAGFLFSCATRSVPEPNLLQKSSEGSEPRQSSSRPHWVKQQRIWDESRYGQWLKSDVTGFIKQKQGQINEKVAELKILEQVAKQSISAREDYIKEQWCPEIFIPNDRNVLSD